MDSIGEKPAGGKSGVGVLDKAVGILSFLAEGGPAPLAGGVRGTGLARPAACGGVSEGRGGRVGQGGGGPVLPCRGRARDVGRGGSGDGAGAADSVQVAVGAGGAR